MILDKYLIFAKKTASGGTTTNPTKAIPLGQKDLTGETDGLGPYQNMWIVVQPAAAWTAAFNVILQHADLEAGPWTNVATFTTRAAGDAGDIALKAPMPFRVKNWVRLNLGSALDSDSFLVYGVDKAVIIND